MGLTSDQNKNIFYLFYGAANACYITTFFLLLVAAANKPVGTRTKCTPKQNTPTEHGEMAVKQKQRIEQIHEGMADNL